MGLIIAGGTLYACINAITPIMVSDFMESFFSQFRNENLFTMANNCECNQGLLEDGSRCLVCEAFPESPDSNINDITDIVGDRPVDENGKWIRDDLLKESNTTKDIKEPNRLGDRPPEVFNLKKEKSNSVNL